MSASNKLILRNGRLLDPASAVDRPADVLVEGDTIRQISDPGKADAAGKNSASTATTITFLLCIIISRHLPLNT